MEQPIINRVAQSSLKTLNLEEYYHHGERVIYDLKDNLFQGLILKEMDFRSFVNQHDWASFKGKNVAILCSEDVVIPTWAYMLLVAHLEPHAHHVVMGDLAALEQALFQEALGKIDLAQYKDAKLIIKGCGQVPVPPYAYVEITRKLMPVVASIMYGEPCSTVPIYKRPKVGYTFKKGAKSLQKGVKRD